MNTDNPCPCGSQQEYAQCCGAYISGTAKAPTAEALMRSRYTAYTQQNDDYLLRTWHPDTRPTDDAPSDDDNTIWNGLTVLRTEAGGENDKQGIVEFIATCQVRGAASQLHEISNFVFSDGQWFYVDGSGQQPQRRSETKIGRNDPCHCGSGKKFKKCCGP